MSEATPPAPRPEPLRVPVVDVATRNSLVSPTPRPPAAVVAQPAVVIQRAVRVISDVPTPPDGQPTAAEAHAARPLEVSPLSPLPEPPGGAPRVAAPTPGVMRAPAPPPAPSTSSLPPADARPAAAAAAATSLSESYALVEVEALDPLELAEGFEADEPDEEDDGSLDDTAEFDEDGGVVEEHVLDVSVPPPAPPEALRKSSPSNDNDHTDVEITVSEDDTLDDEEDEEPSRPSGEFEELELIEARAAGLEPHRSLPPPPPPPRISIPEPPDLSTLTRSARVQEIRPSKPRSHPWWEVFFDDDYLRTVRPPSSEQIARQCDFIEKRLRLKPGATLLDVGCGLGLTVVELCTRGFLGVGLDLSLAMLSRASEEAQGRGMRINFLHSDMRDMNFEGAFDALMCLGTTFGYFDDDTNRRVLDRFLRALKPGGVLLLDVVNRDHVIRAQPNLVWFEGDGCVCMEESEFNFFTSRLHVKRTVILDGGKQTETEYALRLYSLHELGQLLHQSGFRVTEVSGREALPGVFFGQESPQMLIVAERRGPVEGGGPKVESTGKYPAATGD